jgi:hypothetical protein
MADTFVDALGRVVEFPAFYEMLALIYNNHVLEVFTLDEFVANEGYFIINWDEGDWYHITDDKTLEEMYNNHVLEVFESDSLGANEGYLIIDWDEGDWYYIPNDNALKEMYTEAYNATLEDAVEHGAYPLDY